jgi:putative CocE/NonD family hydrolase
VYPDGRSFNVCEGILRARHRTSRARERPLKPGKVYAFDLDLWSTSIVFNRGHRLRVLVTSSSAPAYDPNPNTGAPFRQNSESRAAQNTVQLSRSCPSHLILPVVR